MDFRQFHHVQYVADCSLKVSKETTAFEPGSWEWKVSCHHEGYSKWKRRPPRAMAMEEIHPRNML